MAAPSGTVWGSIVGGYGRIGIYVSLSNTSNTVTLRRVEVWFWSKYSVSDTSNTFYYNDQSSTATTSKGSVSIKTTVDSGGGWSTSNQVKLATYDANCTRFTYDNKRNVAAKLAGIDRVGGTMTCTTSYTIPKKPSYTISYNANGGSGAPGSQTKWHGDNLTLSNTRPSRTGYTFAGWATSSSGSVAYQPGGTYSSNASVTLYAKWTANTYKVSFNPNGGTGGPSYQTKTYGVNLTLSTSKPTRTNYNFVGWGTSASSTSASYQPGGTYTANSAITLYAIWSLAYKLPRLSGFSAQRCNSSGTASESGTYLKVSFSWSTDRSVSAIYIQWRSQSTSTWTSAAVTASGTSGSVSQVVGSNGINTESSYYVRAYVQDSGGTTYSSTASIGTVKFPIDVKSGGTGIAFGKVAENANMADFGWIAKFRKGIEKYGDNTVATTSSDTTANWGNYPNTLHFYSQTGLLNGQISQWGYLLNLGAGSEIHQIWMTQSSGDMAHRGGNGSGWNGSWRRFLDSSNYSSYVVPKSGGSFTGSINVGSGNSHNAIASQWLGWYRSSDGARVGWMGANSTNDIYISPEQGSAYISSDLYIACNDARNKFNLSLWSGTGTYDGNVYIFNNGSGYMCLGQGDDKIDTIGGRLYLEPSTNSTYDMFVRPRNTRKTTLGTDFKRFYRVYVGLAENVSSDRRLKEDFTNFDDRYIQLFEKLKPTIYKLKALSKEKSKIGGFIAQDIEESMKECGIDKREFGIYKYSTECDEYSLVYDMFLPLIVHYVQTKHDEYEIYKEETNKTIQSQQKEINYLKDQVQELKDLVLNLSKNIQGGK